MADDAVREKSYAANECNYCQHALRWVANAVPKHQRKNRPKAVSVAIQTGFSAYLMVTMSPLSVTPATTLPA